MKHINIHQRLLHCSRVSKCTTNIDLSPISYLAKHGDRHTLCNLLLHFVRHNNIYIHDKLIENGYITKVNRWRFLF